MGHSMQAFNHGVDQGLALPHSAQLVIVLGLFVGLACIVYGLASTLANHMGRAARRKGQG